MAVFQLLSITSPTATGSQTYSHSLGVVPKAVIALSTWLGSVDVINTHAAIMVGVSDGTNQFSASFVSADSAVTSNTSRVVSDSLIHQVDFNEGTLFRANLTAWDATSFTLNWTATTNGRRIELLLIGGSDVQAKALTFNSPIATGRQSITGVGFTPDLALFLGAGPFSNALGTPQVHGAVGLGVAERFTPAQWAVEVWSLDNTATADTQRIQDNTASLIAVTTSLGLFYRAVLQSWDADGVTLNWTTVQPVAYRQVALFLKGLGAKAGTFTARTGSGSQSVTGVGFTPEALLTASIWGGTTNGSGQSNTRLSVGLATGPMSEASVNAYDQNVADSMVSKTYRSTTRLLVEHTTSVERTFDLTSFDADGFSGSWSATGTGDQIGYLALATASETFQVLAEAVSSSIAALVKRVSKQPATQSGSTATTSKRAGKRATATSTSAASLMKRVGKAFSLLSASTASVSWTRIVEIVSAFVVSPSTVELRRLVSRSFSVTSTSQASLAKLVTKVVSSLSPSVASATRKGLFRGYTITGLVRAVVEVVGKVFVEKPPEVEGIIEVERDVTGQVRAEVEVEGKIEAVREVEGVVSSSALIPGGEQ